MSLGCKARKAAHAAAKNTASTFEDVIDQVTPMVQQAGKQALETLSSTKDTLEDLFEQHLAPKVTEAVEKVSPAVSQAVEKVSPVVSQAYEKVSPTVEKAYDKVSPAVSQAYERAYEKVSPVVSQAYGDVSDRIEELQPKLAELIDKAPLPEEVKPAKRRGVLGKIFWCLGITGVLTALVVFARKFLSSGDDGWAPAAQGVGWTPAKPKTTEAHAKRAEEAAAEAEEHATESEGYGEGAYVGENPPEGFAIKGNERSMKYHTPNATSWERTNADVWFANEAAAQAAGFTRATR